MTITLSLPQLAAGVIAVAGLLTALGVLAKYARRGARLLRAIHNVVDRELTHNHGTSIKDDVTGLTVGYGVLARQVDGLEERFTAHLAESKEHH